MPRVVPSQVVALIDKLFPQARTQTEGGKEIPLSASHASQLAGILDLVQQIPSELLVLSPEQFAEYTVSVAGIRELLERLKALGNYGFSWITGLRHLSPVTIIRQALASCPDEFPAAGTAELSFISEKDLRESLRIDISAVNSALSNGEWKAATILAGSVIEALLLWVLQQHKKSDVTSAVQKLVRSNIFKNPGTNLGKWGLHEFIEVAAELSAVETDTATLARLARNYRNLIHPGKAQRLGQVCDRGTALTAVAALEHVVDDLSP